MNKQAVRTDLPRLHTFVQRVEHRFNTCGVHFTIALYGNKDGDWSTRQLTLPHTASQEYRDRLGVMLDEQGVITLNTLVMPKEFNARMVGQEHFRKDNVWAGSHELFRNARYPGEGLLLNASQAALLTPSNCATGVLIFEGRLAVVHFGRWSLFDQHLVRYGTPDPERKHESILYAALESLGAISDRDAAKVVAFLFWGARPEDFLHPTMDSPHANTNKRLYAYMQAELSLDLPIRSDKSFGFDLLRVAKRQLRKCGVPYKNITDMGALPGSGVWRDGGTGKGRNGVLVVRHK